ncbi:TonB-dependent receptor [Hyphococcus sp.]|uniref:TonB-dependent receptor n=1 Tax=Hyphococcus sp. TaxID=2038636 RepID=UPI002083F4C0|nr:MAG: TonB-dependent receptor [Marinicaulis sp.]
MVKWQNNTVSNSLFVFITGAVMLTTTSGFASAGNNSPMVDIVLVTAQKREEDLNDVPISIDVIRDEKLDVIRSAGQDILFLASRSPSLYAESSSGRIFPRFYIRGLGNTDFDLNANQPVSLVYDETVLENPILKGFPVFDLDRIEILRGPQGTLFGRNTPAGVIKFESAKPTEIFEGYGRVSYGRFNTVDTEAAISGPLAGDKLTGRLSVLAQRRDDFVDNTFTAGGEEGFEEFSEFAGRAQLLIRPNDRVSSLVNVHGRKLDGGSRLFRANIIEPGVGGLVANFRRDETAQDATQILEVYNIGASLKTDVDFDFGQLTSITSYEQVGVSARGDVDGGFGASFAPPSGPGFIPFSAESADNITGHDQITQELRLTFSPATGITTTLGGFFFYENLEIENLSFDTLANGDLNGRAVQDQETLSWALFGSSEWSVTDRFSLQGGLRLSGEEKDFRAERLIGPFGSGPLAPQTLQVDDVVLSGDVSATYAFTQDTNIYARYARGFRAPNVQGRVVFGDVVTVADTETIDSIEAGLKHRFWDGRGNISVSGFWYQTDNQQLTAVGGAGNFNQLLNADAVIGYGFEVDASFTPIDGLHLTAGVSLNETEINDRNLEVGICGASCTVLNPINPATGNALIDGNRLPQAPRWIANATLRYGVPVFGGAGEVFAFTDWAYRSQINFFLYESIEFQDRSLLEGGVRIGYANLEGQYEIAAFARNITNARAIEGAIDFNNFSGFVNDPPVWGVELSKQF